MTGFPWYARRAGIFQREVDALAATFPEFARCESVHDQVIFHGRLQFRSSKGTVAVILALSYPDDYPLQPPRVVPLAAPELAEPHDPRALTVAQMYPFRHQMADGALCLFDRGGEARDIQGVDALRRAERWMRDMRRGILSPDLDSINAEIQEHYTRHGHVIAGPTILDATLPTTGRLLALQVSSNLSDPRYVLTHAEGAAGWVDERTILDPFLKSWANDQLGDGYFEAATNPAFLEVGKYNASAIWVGAYVTLEHEPPIVRSAADVALLLYPKAADPLAEMIASYGTQIQTHSGVVVAVRYPERRTNRLTWLFLSLRIRSRAADQAKDPQTGLVVPILDFSKSRAQQLSSARDRRTPSARLSAQGAPASERTSGPA